MNWPLVLLSLFVTGITGASAAVDDKDRIIVPLDGASLPDTLARNNVDVDLLKSGPQRGLSVKFHVTDWPNVYFRPVNGVWDWSGYTGIAVDVYNPEADAVSVNMRVDNAGADGVKNCNQQSTSAKPGSWTTFRLRFNRGGDNSLWGMRGLPITGPTGGGAVLDMAKITAFQIFLAKPSSEHRLILNNFRLYGGGVNTDEKVKLPFVDRFGQYKNGEWPGKLKSEAELVQRSRNEEAALQQSPMLAGRDRFGGWADGPKQKATGWFRTEKIDGRWWLVTPEGSLFFSTGIDCVAPGEYTYIDGRDNWFEWLPAARDPYAEFIGRGDGAHSMAELIGGKGRTYSFYCSNLYRKYQDDWRSKWADASASRMRSWGFNTVGNWSDEEFISRARIPFVATGGISGAVRRIEGGGGYWGKMVDAYDPAFSTAAETSLSEVGRKYASDPYCIGYFADNEIAWEAVEKGTLASPPDQPCRIAEVEMLKTKYNGSLDQLITAWSSKAGSWDALRTPENPNAACQADLDAFVYQFAKRYFEVCKAAFKKSAPNQLYLGCRFASAPKPAVRACADVADVVSFNIYSSSVNSSDWTGAKDLGKPILIGEFHFGALDRGMFHEGLGPRANQEERAAAYLAYVRSVADCPNFVGCHWFQYVDEPLTGRWFDGENYNIGLVDVTDTPYPELLAAAKKANAEVYARHAAKTSSVTPNR
jgi:hypothetical protein